jgi:hypothetical protein
MTTTSNPPKKASEPLFKGLNLEYLFKEMAKYTPLKETGEPQSPATSSWDDRQTGHTRTMFSGLDIEKTFNELKTIFELDPIKKQTDIKSKNISSAETTLSTIPTADVITSLIRIKKNKRVKASTLATYEKRLKLFQQQFTFLPDNSEAITGYLSRFDGESGRHRRNQQDLLNMLYEHAIHRFGFTKNPVAELERPLITRKPVKTLSLSQVQALNQAPENLQERTALDLLLGHGWRQIELGGGRLRM